MNKKDAKPSVPKAVEDCRDLLLWMIPQLDKLPKNRRYTLGEKLENRLIVVLESLVSAAYAPSISLRRSLLVTANRDLEVSRHLWRLCFEFKAVPDKSFQHGSLRMFELGKQVGGWLRSA